VTTGQSLRSVPRSCIQEVKQICMYYVQKCSGQYLDNKAASRYVHQMAEEIILQLAGVASEIKKNRGEPEMYQALLDEWNEYFPPSLGKGLIFSSPLCSYSSLPEYICYLLQVP
jgi:hypothetical protein